MAAVLDAFARKLADILAGMAKDEVGMLLGVPGEITKLETTLGDLSSILTDAERRRIRDRNSATERWVRELRDVMYDADNILDLCQIVPAKTASRCWNIPIASCFRDPVAAHKIGKKIRALNNRLLDIEKRSSRFGFISQVTNPSSGSSLDQSRKTGSALIRYNIVGEKIEEDTVKLVNLLVGARAESNIGGVAIVAVTGAGGIGKTTLARMVFNNSLVEENFDEKIWLSVNQEFSEIAIMQSVISAFGGNYDGCAGDKALLEGALKQVVRNKKFLLVMDDVWSDMVWNELLQVSLNDGASGSQVLVTTRNNGVARGMRAQHIHPVDKLALKDAWSLLKKQVVLNESDESEVDRLDDIGMKIVERCDGLPLAIKVVGGLLLNKSRTRGAWMGVSNHIAWSITGTNDDLNRAVYLSYDELPSHLKQCLLYCSLFPKDEIIVDSVIVLMWMAEGFIQNSTSSELPEDLGSEYYRELISRNLLEPDNKYYNQSGCTMHDVIRSFAQYLAKDEGLLLNKGQDVSSTLGNLKLRHLSICREVAELGALQTQTSLRTLMLFRSPMVTLKDYSCLRVLLIDDVNLVELPESVCDLKHLRYLGVRGASISTIPKGIGDLKFLQIIDFRRCINLSQLPNIILKLHKLRFVNFKGTKITSVPRGFGKLEDLVQLLGFPTHLDDNPDGWCSLEELGSLSKLTRLDIVGLEKASSGSVAARAKLCSKPRLTHLWLTFTTRLGHNGKAEDYISKQEQERTEEVVGNLCPPTCIEILAISGYFGHQIPRWMRTMSVFESLRRFELSDYACCEQLPNGLGQLPFLDYLWVERAPSVKCIGHDLLLPSVGVDAAGMDKTPVSAGRNTVDRTQCHHLPRGAGVAFPKLRSLGFEGMLGWREWEWEQRVRAMPALELLTIEDCELSYLPPGLAYHATALRYLDIKNVPHLVCIDSFPSLTALHVTNNPNLARIANNPSLQHISIFRCQGVKALEDLPSLRTIGWRDLDAKALPDYLREAKLNKLFVECSLSLLKQISLQDATSEWGKIQHIQHLKAIGRKSEQDEVNGVILYTKEPYSFKAELGEASRVHSLMRR